MKEGWVPKMNAEGREEIAPEDIKRIEEARRPQERVELREALASAGARVQPDAELEARPEEEVLRADPRPPRPEKSDPEQTTMSRRSFLRGAAATGAAALTPKELGMNEVSGPAPETAPEPPERPEQLDHTDSAFFEAYADAFVEQYQQNLPEIVEYGSKITNGDLQERTRFAYLNEEFAGDRLPPRLRAEMQEVFPAIAVVESGLVGDKVSSKGAKGILQIMPSTFEWLGEEGENELSLIVQARVASELIERTYLHWQNKFAEPLDAIKDRFFNGDSDAFERDFLGPALIDSYNVGMGLMGDVFAWFEEQCKNIEDVQQLLGTEKLPSGKDVFVAMVRGARKAGVYRDIIENGKVVGKAVFGEDAEEYTFKVTAAEKALTDYTPQEDLALLWKGPGSSS